MADDKNIEAELALLVARFADAASAFIRGDIREYLRLTPHTDDFTLMPPTGGETRHGFDTSDDALDAIARYFRGGEAALEVVATHASGDIAVLVVIERQHGEVGGLPDQDLSLRVTLVLRREAREWRLVHRHADPLVHEISIDQVAALARAAPWQA